MAVRSPAWRGGLAAIGIATAIAWSTAAQSPPASIFALSLPELAGRAFAAGGLIEVPGDTAISRLELALSARQSRKVNEGEVLVRLNDRSTPVTVVTRDDRKVATYRVPDLTKPFVVRQGAELRIRAYVKDNNDLSEEWLVRAGATPFIVEKAGDKDGERLNIVLKAPTDRPLLFAGTSQLAVEVRGEIYPAHDLRHLAVGAAAIPPDRTQDRLTFRATTMVEASTREIVVEAGDDFGRSAAVVIPIVRAGGTGPRRQ